MHRGAVQTFIAPGTEIGAAAGLLQTRLRREAPEADFTFIAPALDGGNGAAHTWSRLIVDACQWLGAQGIERVYAAIAEDDQVALQLFRACGFSAFTTDVVFERSSRDGAADGAAVSTTPLGPDHQLAVRRIVHNALPDTVRRCGAELGGDWFRYPLGGHASGTTDARACVDARGRVVGAWRVGWGRSACWLQAVARPDADVGTIVGAALASMASDGRSAARPVWSCARGYETDLNLALRESGFQPRLRRFRLVKHMAVRVLAPAWDRGAVGERGLDPATSSSVKLTAAEPPRESRIG
jgi:hypothetical protein